MIRWLWMVALCTWILVPSLTITLHNAEGQPLAGVAFLVADRSGQQILGQAITDGAGTAQVFDLALSEVRIVCRGVLPSGQPCRLPGTDPGGFLVFVDVGGTTQIDLLVDTQGMLALDPLTMWVQEGVDVPLPAAPTPAVVPPLSDAPSIIDLASPEVIVQESTVPTRIVESNTERIGSRDTALAQPTMPLWTWMLLGLTIIGVLGIGVALHHYGRAEP
jgi:hypothetical protein